MKSLANPVKITVCKKNIQIISTHLLTVLIMYVILHVEQRKGNKKKRSESGVGDVDNTQEQSESA